MRTIPQHRCSLLSPKTSWNVGPCGPKDGAGVREISTSRPLLSRNTRWALAPRCKSNWCTTSNWRMNRTVQSNHGGPIPTPRRSEHRTLCRLGPAVLVADGPRSGHRAAGDRSSARATAKSHSRTRLRPSTVNVRPYSRLIRRVQSVWRYSATPQRVDTQRSVVAPSTKLCGARHAGLDRAECQMMRSACERSPTASA
jgi:hypothetical protein